MSWHYLQGQAAESWEGESLGGAPDALSRLIPSVDESYCNDDPMESSGHSPSGMTREHSMEFRGGDQLTLLREDSHARTSVQRVSVSDLPGPVRTFGSKCLESLGRLGLALSSRKTVRTCVPLGSAHASKDLPGWGMMYDGVCWELGMSVRRTIERECGYLPTPMASDSERMPIRDHYAHKPKQIKAPDSLTQATARRCQCGTNAHRLSPNFAEYLMGWPIGWSDCEPLEMGRYHSWLRLHGAY